MKVAGLCLFLHFLFYEHLASVSDVDALLRLVQALTSKKSFPSGEDLGEATPVINSSIT